jgi:hypothetical protein
MAGRKQPSSQGWKTFLRNHANGIASMDLFVVPTISFRLLYGFRSDGIVLTMLLCSANGISTHLLKSYQKYYNEARTHLSLQKDATISRAVQTVDRTLAIAFHLIHLGRADPPSRCFGFTHRFARPNFSPQG